MALSEKYICIRNVDYDYLKSKLKSKYLLNKMELIKLRLDINKNNDVPFKFKTPYLVLGVGSLINIKRPDKFILLIDFLVKKGYR